MKSVVIVGAGMNGLRLWEALMQCGNVDVVAFVDADARLHGRTRAGLPVHPPCWLDSFTGEIVAASGGTAEYSPSRQLGAASPAQAAADSLPAADRIAYLPTHLDDDALRRAALCRYPDPLAATLSIPAAAARTRLGIFGTGAAATKVWEAVSELDDVEPLWFADNDVRQHGHEFLWLPVIAPSSIRSHDAEFVVVGSMSRDAISRQLLLLGVPADRILMPDVSAGVDAIRKELRRLVPIPAVHEVLV